MVEEILANKEEHAEVMKTLLEKVGKAKVMARQRVEKTYESDPISDPGFVADRGLADLAVQHGVGLLP
jgi:hypothetical protein